MTSHRTCEYGVQCRYGVTSYGCGLSKFTRGIHRVIPYVGPLWKYYIMLRLQILATATMTNPNDKF